MKTPLPCLLILGALSATAPAVAPAPALAQTAVAAVPDQAQAALLADPDPLRAANKKVVFDFLRIVLDAAHTDEGAQYVQPDYIEHNPVLPNGRDAAMKFFGQMPRKPVQPYLKGLVAILADGDLVSVIFRIELNDPHTPGARYTTSHFDMFRLKDGKIAEHWDDHRKDSAPPADLPPPPA